MIENRLVVTATCDACGHINYGDDKGHIRSGFGVTVVSYENHDTVDARDAYACRPTHIGKAVRAVLDHDEEPVTVPEGHDAPPLPQPERADCA